MKKRRHRDNRRKTVAKRKAAYTRDAHARMWGAFELPDQLRQHGDERKFLLDALQPMEAAIAQAVIPHLPGLLWDDPVDDLYDEMVAYAFDLIFNNEDEADPIAAAVCAVHRDGPEAVLPHLERAIQWNVDFNARRR